MQFDRDTDAFGVNTIPDPPLQRTTSNASEASTISASTADTSTTAYRQSMSDSDSCASSYSRVPRRRHRRQARKDAGPLGTIKVAAFTLCAAGLVAAVAQRGGVLPLAPAKPEQQQQREQKLRKHARYASTLAQAKPLSTLQEEE